MNYRGADSFGLFPGIFISLFEQLQNKFVDV